MEYSCYALFWYSLKKSLLAANVGKIISAHPQISAHPHGPKMKQVTRTVNQINTVF